MSNDDNVVKFPAALERDAKEVREGLDQWESGNESMVKGILKTAVALAAARAKFPHNADFGEWCDQNGFGERRLPKDERGNLIQWGEQPDWTRTVLEKTERKSIQMIHRHEWSVRSSTKTTPAAKPVGGPKLQAAKAYAQAYEAETGKLPTEREVAREIGVSPGISADALRLLKDRRADDNGRLQFTKAQDAHVQARLRILSKANNAEFNERVRLAMLEHNKDYRATLDELQRKAQDEIRTYNALNNNFKPLFTVEEYKIILMVAHPDANPSTETRETAFKALKAKEIQLIGRKL